MMRLGLGNSILTACAFVFSSAACSQSEPEKVELCASGPLGAWIKCQYPNAGPYGFHIDMDASDVKVHMQKIAPLIDKKQVLAWKRDSSSGRNEIRYLAFDDVAISDLTWATGFEIPYERDGKVGNVFYELQNGNIVSIRWEWSIDLP